METDNTKDELRKQILEEMNARRIDHRTYVNSEWLLSEYDKTLHQELQKAREQLVEEIRTDLLNYRDERLDDNASITNIAIRIGMNYPRKDQSNLDHPTISK